MKKEDFNILVACEESQEITKRFREMGFNCYSCDIIDCSGGFPQCHIKCDVRKVLKGGLITTCDNATRYIDKWNMIIAHPPCTYLTVSGNRWYDIDKYGDKARERIRKRGEAIGFFKMFTLFPCKYKAIENPIGIMSTIYGKPTQIIQPFWFGETERKATCLWLENLPPLKPTNLVQPDILYFDNGKKSMSRLYYSGNKKDRAKIRSKTFPGVAQAIVEQWGKYIIENENIEVNENV